MLVMNMLFVTLYVGQGLNTDLTKGVFDGPPVVFVHGLLANSRLWRKVVPTVAEAGFRCVVPDWPLGAHEIPAPDADLTPPGVAALIDRFLAALELTDVTVVANDTG
ncbi:MAG: alpha/beta fold hydrolase, partial [Actinophytocola sp.]|nr:alpha/beta fold hydrolase [Actinophytocola sp.]